MIFSQISPTAVNVPETGYGFTPSVIGQAVIFLTTVVGIWVQVYRENRAHRWAKEDADETRRKLVEENEVTRKQNEAIVRHIGDNVSQVVTNTANIASDERKEVKQLVGETKIEAGRAYTEANNVNVKIADLNNRLLREESVKKSQMEVKVVNKESDPVPVKSE